MIALRGVQVRWAANEEGLALNLVVPGFEDRVVSLVAAADLERWLDNPIGKISLADPRPNGADPLEVLGLPNGTILATLGAPLGGGPTSPRVHRICIASLADGLPELVDFIEIMYGASQ